MIYKNLIRPILFALSRNDPEIAHELVLSLLRTAGRHSILLKPIQWLTLARNTELQQTLCGLYFRNPVGLAAGFDKDGVALPALSCLGFGFLEMGSVVPRPQPGNPRPRIQRIPKEEGLRNRMGFNSAGRVMVRRNLQAASGLPVPLGVNIGKNKETPLEDADDDYCCVLEDLWLLADYFVLNISSPNTPGLRLLQGKNYLDELLCRIMECAVDLADRHHTGLKPIWVKVAPDVTDGQLSDIQAVCIQRGVGGLVLANTKQFTDDHSVTWGVSGPLLRARAKQMVQQVAAESQGQLVITAVGGINSPWTAGEMLDAGAQLIQLYTGLVYEGPLLPRTIVQSLIDRNFKQGSINNAVEQMGIGQRPFA